MNNNTLQFDINNNIERPDVYLRNRNLVTIGCLNSIEELKVTKNLNAFHELSFSIPKLVNDLENPFWDKINDLSIVFIPQFGNFEITVSNNTTGIIEKKNISGKSLEVELDHVKLYDLQINSSDIEDDDYSSIKLYNPFDVNHSLLHIILKKVPSWKMLHVDDSLKDKQRTFDINDVSIYSFLTSTLAAELNCIFIFDSFNRSISCYSLDNYGFDTNIFIDCENYASEITVNAPAEQIFNWFKVYGGDDIISIREVNPNGTDYVTVLGENTLSDMTPELVNKLSDYDKVYKSRQDEFIEIMKNIQAQEDIIWDLKYKYPENTPSDNDYSSYGLNYLVSLQDSFQSVEDSYLTMGYGSKQSQHYPLYDKNHDKLLDIKREIEIRNSEIEAQSIVRDQYFIYRNAIQEQLDLEKYLGTTLFLELSNYKRESTYKNEYFTVTDYTTDSERIEMEIELMNRAIEDLRKACNPQPTLTSTISNLLAKTEFQDMALKDFQLGNFIHVGINDDYIAKIRLIKIEYDFNNISDINVEFSDMFTSLMNDAQKILQQAQSASESYKIVSQQMSNASDELGFVAKLRKDGLDTALTQITASTDQSTTIDEHGILLRQWNKDKLDWEDQQLKLINNLLCFTNDSWRSVQSALGYVNVNNQMVYGLITDAFVGKWIFTENAFIGNEENTMTFDKSGFRAYSSDFKTLFSINPNKKDGLLEIWNNFNTPAATRTVWIDASGNAWFQGNITASSITSSKFICSNNKNTVIIDPSDPSSIFTILKGSDKQIYFDVEGNAVFKGRMTIGSIFSENWITSGGSETGKPEGKEGTYINLNDGTFHFGGTHLELTEKYLQCNGVGDYTWMGKNFGKANIYTKVTDGRISLKHLGNEGYDLNITPTGIATTITAHPDSTSIIDMYSQVYGKGRFGLTLQTNGSPIGLKSRHGSILINPHAETFGNDPALFWFSREGANGIINLGYYSEDNYSTFSGFKFSGNGEKSLVTVLGAGSITGDLKCRNIEIDSGTLSGKDIATQDWTKDELDRLETEYLREINYWKDRCQTAESDLRNMTRDRDNLQSTNKSLNSTITSLESQLAAWQQHQCPTYPTKG
ncbi:hypothetical protein [Lachnoclostridium sp.]|uniref:hypothetical protein n=1 Tax=Lachnoclostridium sp. TaxID=2028282 RepID=UPI0028A0E914|nr:hypothetical protein [Lachnoclostridium sp.]